MTGKSSKGMRVAVRKGKTGFALALAAMLVLIIGTSAQAAFFDTAGQTARPMAMGEVFLASKGDVSAAWYNAAGLTALNGRSLGISYGIINPTIASDLMNYQLTYVNPLGETSGFAIGVAGLGADGANEMVINGAYGMALGEKLSFGGNVKVMRWAMEGQKDLYSGSTDDDLSKMSFSLDLSANYALGEVFGLADFCTGLYVKDAIMPNISESGDDGGKLPLEIGLGLMGQRGLTLGEVDVAFVNGQTVFRAGVESGVLGSGLKLRGGAIYGSDFADDTERTDLDIGLGYAFSSMVFDYAYNIPLVLHDSGGRHFFAFGLSF